MKPATCKLIIAILLSGLILAACGGEVVPTESLLDLRIDPCGDGTCQEDETYASCPADCPAEAELLPTPTEEIDPLGYITFVVKVGDFIHLDQSSETLLKLVDLFESNGVKGDFYLTGPMTHAYMEKHPEVIQRLTDTGMTISYQVRPPHPLVPGFQGPLQIGAVNLKLERIEDYESHRLDLRTGGLLESEPGGFRYLTEIFKAPPYTVSTPKDSIQGFALPLFPRMGAQMVVLDHPSNTSIDNPLVQVHGMWVRPADIQISHWTSVGIDASMAWWDMLATDFAASYQPVSHLQEELESWGVDRLPFVIVTIDAYNFYREGPPPWTMIYYQAPGSTQPNSPPYNLDAPDLTSPRSPENEIAVWEAYSDLVEWAATYMQVVTSADIVHMATMGE